MKDRKAPKVKQQPDPESEAWAQLPWHKFEKHVYRIQKRIYRASQSGNQRTVQKLQKLLMKSEAAQLLAVRKVTQENQGKKTAGVDGIKSVPPKQRLEMAKQLHPKHWKRSKSKPVRRVWIPKPGKKDQQRPLGIPIMMDRAQQALVKAALEPEWEAKFEPNSYGFRPGRSAHDAIEAIFNEIRCKPKFVLDADIKGCFDNIDQDVLLEKLQAYPQIKGVIKAWLKAGVIDKGVTYPTEKGTPQGGVISPLLMNIALHGMEQAVTEGYRRNAPKLIRYADDLIIFHSEKAELEKATQRLTAWLEGIGLTLSESKTKVTHTYTPYQGNVGFDFLGFTVRQYPVGKTHSGKTNHGKPLGFKTIIAPSKEAMKRHAKQIREEVERLQAAPQAAVIKRLNGIIIGWCNYYKTVAASAAFAHCDYQLHGQLTSWSNKRHPNKGKRWIYEKYWPRREGKRNFQTFAEGKEGKVNLTLRRHNQTHIQKHVKVRGNASPYDGNLLYWSKRLTDHPLMDSTRAKLLRAQKGQCPRCGLYFESDDLLEIDHIVPTALGGRDIIANKWVYHAHCHDKKTAEDAKQIRMHKEATGVNNK